MRLRWPESRGRYWRLRPGRRHPGYSKQQYRESFLSGGETFAEAVLLELNPDLDFRERLKTGIRDLRGGFRQRKRIVREGVLQLS
jgi:hypothetical protein